MGVVGFREANPNWKGGKSITPHGYVLVLVKAGHHLANAHGYAYEHRLVAEEKLGRRLVKGEEVHHIDGNKQNNDPANIEVLDRAEHAKQHRKRKDLRDPGEINDLIACGCGCGIHFPKFDQYGRPRRFLPSHNMKIRGY